MNVFLVRRRTFFAVAVCAVIGVGVMTMAQHLGNGQAKSTQVSQRDIIEKLDGKDASATVRLVTIEPGQKDSAHLHAGPVFGYVLEGRIRARHGRGASQGLQGRGNVTNRRALCTRVARNLSAKTKTRLLAVILHPRDATEVTIRQKGKE